MTLETVRGQDRANIAIVVGRLLVGGCAVCDDQQKRQRPGKGSRATELATVSHHQIRTRM